MGATLGFLEIGCAFNAGWDGEGPRLGPLYFLFNHTYDSHDSTHAHACAQAGFAPMRPLPPLRIWTTRLAPIIFSTAATMFFGNAAYLHLSVAFIQVGVGGMRSMCVLRKMPAQYGTACLCVGTRFSSRWVGH